ncbi:MAG: galactokinase family protein [Planctomycetota bacterium]|jgi:galactokinase
MGELTRIVSAPARVNLLGEQIDHQGGTVLPIAVHFRTTVAYEPRQEWTIESEGHEAGGDWEQYVLAVIDQLAGEGHAPRPGRLSITSSWHTSAGGRRTGAWASPAASWIR